MANIHIGDNITLLNKNNKIECEMVCFDIFKDIYLFQAVDNNGEMKVLDIPDYLMDLLNWKESPIIHFFEFEQISEILETYHNLNQLDIKGFSGYYNDSTNVVKSVSLYFSTGNLYLEVICFGALYPFIAENKNHYFSNINSNIPYIYVKETNSICELHLERNNCLFFTIPNNYDSFNMKDVSCWAGNEYISKLFFPIEQYPLTSPSFVKSVVTLEGVGVEFETEHPTFQNNTYTGNSIVIFDHKNKDVLRFYNNGILIDTKWYQQVKYLEFIKNIKF